MPQVCDGHAATIVGRYSLCYPALLDDGVRYFRRIAYCATCLMDVVNRHRKEWDVGGAFIRDSGQYCCRSCGQVPDEGVNLTIFFFTAYPKKDQRLDYESRYCSDCADLIKNEFRLEKQNGRH